MIWMSRLWPFLLDMAQVVSVVNPIGLTIEAESRNLSGYEGRLQLGLVGIGRIVLVKSFIAG